MTRSPTTAPKATAKSQSFIVMMHPTLVDELDEGFSPMDGLVAIDQMFSEFPLLHRALPPKRLAKRPHRRLTVYRGCYDWYKSLGFTYVQAGTTLHVLELWYDENPNLSQLDVILGTGYTEGYEPFAADGDKACDTNEDTSADIKEANACHAT
jgi:hypothetical protein